MSAEKKPRNPWLIIGWIILAIILLPLAMCSVAVVGVSYSTVKEGRDKAEAQSIRESENVDEEEPPQAAVSSTATEQRTQVAQVPTTSASTMDLEQQAKANLEQCRLYLTHAGKAGVLTNADISRIPPRFTVGPRWHRVDFEVKTDVAKAIECVLFSGKSGEHMPFYFIDSMTGKVVAKWNYNRLEVE